MSPTFTQHDVSDVRVSNVKLAREFGFISLSRFKAIAYLKNYSLGQFVVAGCFSALPVWRSSRAADMLPCVEFNDGVNRALRGFVTLRQMLNSFTSRISGANFKNLLVRKFGKASSFTNRLSIPPLFHAIGHVLFCGARKQMARITTGRIIAMVANLQAARIAVGQNVGPSRAAFRDAPDIDRHALKRLRSNPRPASVWPSRFVDFIPKAFTDLHSSTLTLGT